MENVMSIDSLLQMNLDIPPYQRPYKWSTENISDLMDDITKAIDDANKFGKDFRYRIGTIIIHNNAGKLEVVDGQQRLISFTLLKNYLDPTFDSHLLSKPFDNKVSQENIHNNATFIREWFSSNPMLKETFNISLSNILEVVVLEVIKIEEAFQLFDSQNTRGRELDPHDLLKAYHLREMKKDPYEMEHAVMKWEAKDTSDIRTLFSTYLFPIWNWSKCIKSKIFTAKEIGTYKGIAENTGYTYAKRASKAMPFFQINEPFISGNDFFDMVDHYLVMLKDIENELDTNEELDDIKSIRLKYKNDDRLNYVDNLFICSLLCYYDKFHNFNSMAVKKLFIWAYMLRIDIERIQWSSVNLYAIGNNTNESYTNGIPMFSKISLARLHNEITGLQVRVLTKDGSSPKEWTDLHNDLKKMSGIQEASNG